MSARKVVVLSADTVVDPAADTGQSVKPAEDGFVIVTIRKWGENWCINRCEHYTNQETYNFRDWCLKFFNSFCNIKEGVNLSLFQSQFSPNINEQLKLATLVCARLKTTFNTYGSLYISAVGEDIPLINHMCLVQ